MSRFRVSRDPHASKPIAPFLGPYNNVSKRAMDGLETQEFIGRAASNI